MKKLECNLCGRIKNWQGDNITCPFSSTTSKFSTENWKCGILKDLRSILEPILFKEKSDKRVVCISNEGQHKFLIDLTEIDTQQLIHETLFITWYKSRGRTESILMVSDEGDVLIPKYEDLLDIIKYLNNEKII